MLGGCGTGGGDGAAKRSLTTTVRPEPFDGLRTGSVEGFLEDFDKLSPNGVSSFTPAASSQLPTGAFLD
jgi:hypothetical protein